MLGAWAPTVRRRCWSEPRAMQGWMQSKLRNSCANIMAAAWSPPIHPVRLEKGSRGLSYVHKISYVRVFTQVSQMWLYLEIGFLQRLLRSNKVMGWPLILYSWLVSLWEEIWYRRAHGGKTMWGHREKVAVWKPRREASRETNSADTLISDFQSPGLWKAKFILLRVPVCVLC